MYSTVNYDYLLCQEELAAQVAVRAAVTKEREENKRGADVDARGSTVK